MTKRLRGLAALAAKDEIRQREIARSGGLAARGRYRWTREAAAAAGRKGGLSTQQRARELKEGTP